MAKKFVGSLFIVWGGWDRLLLKVTQLRNGRWRVKSIREPSRRLSSSGVNLWDCQGWAPGDSISMNVSTCRWSWSSLLMQKMERLRWLVSKTGPHRLQLNGNRTASGPCTPTVGLRISFWTWASKKSYSITIVTSPWSTSRYGTPSR